MLLGMTTDIGAQAARDALTDASDARARLARRTQWSSRYFFVYGAATLVLVPIVGLGGPLGAALGTAGFLALAMLLTVLTVRQGAVGAGWGRLHVTAFVTWGLLWAATAVVGLYLFKGEPAFWLPAAVLDASPFFVVGVLARRGVDRR